MKKGYLFHLHRLVLYILIVLSCITANAFAQENISSNRIMGADRYLTAIEISKAGWKSADTVILARGDLYADALAGVPLSYKLDAPILLTSSKQLNVETMDEIRRLSARNVIILGGTTAIAKKTEQSLLDAGLNVERIGGAYRPDTAALIARKVCEGHVNTAVIVYGYDFMDALVAAPFAARMGYPILLTYSKEVPLATVSALNDLGVANCIVVGTESKISNAVLKSLPGAIRVGNTFHKNNSLAVATHFGFDSSLAYIATSTDFADAMTGAALAAKQGSAIFLVGEIVQPELTCYVNGRVHSLTIFGGSRAVSNKVESDLVNPASLEFDSPVDSGIYNISSSSGMCLNAYSDSASAFPYGMVIAPSDGSPEQQVDIQKQADGSYRLKALRNNGMYVYAHQGIEPGKTLNANAALSTDFVLQKHSSGKYVISSKENSQLVLTATNEKPYSTLSHYYVQLTTFTGAENQLWNFKQVNTVPTSSAITFPINIKDSSIGDYSGVVNISDVEASTYGGDISYYINGGEDYTCGHYGTNYRAIDINYPEDNQKDSIYAIADGIVVHRNDGDGTVFISHSVPLTLYDGSRTYNKWFSLYAHMSSISVEVNQRISAGDTIGKLSNVFAKTPHLHFALTTKLYQDNKAFHYGYSKYPGTDDPDILKTYSDATISPYWLSGSFRNIHYTTKVGDIADEAALERILQSTDNAPPSN